MKLIIAVLIVASVWWLAAVWQECRADGHSVLYCLKMVSK